ncbi:hypothetical protein AAFF_G00198540 [Aldrovandia affinis]|uniref:Uncharacterized protein n=1 Tax=Aldrovandia affinis TaxID=143900 RepID=A0AAD7RIG5_9TELE|nr:hypothetical protein AAFF_G00198540 [Aldrovandia affinis]
MGCGHSAPLPSSPPMCRPVREARRREDPLSQTGRQQQDGPSWRQSCGGVADRRTSPRLGVQNVTPGLAGATEAGVSRRPSPLGRTATNRCWPRLDVLLLVKA